ncbi:MAG: LCP family protein, partial [Acutalibacteraceae bacterium]|nr:LCP family protein [Acutalibacteraceae bacterium]
EMGKETGKPSKATPKKEKAKKNKEKEIKLDSLTKKPGFFARLKAGFLKLSKPKKALVISLLSVITAIILAICIIAGWLIGFVAEVKQNYNHKEITDKEISEIVPIDEKIMNVALFGIDSRKMGSFTGLSDSIMILSINTGTGDLKLISVMRDSIVEIPNHNGKSYRPNKINSAYAVDGPELAIKTLNKNFGLDIKEYATVNFYGMAEIIEAVDGIEVEVRQAEINAKNGLNANIREQCMHMKVDATPYLVKKAGKQVLNGVQAVGWARIRSVATTQGTANDYGRTDRQRYVMEQLLNKALSLDIAKYPDLIRAILPHMETSISFDEALSLAVNVLGNKVEFE